MYTIETVLVSEQKKKAFSRYSKILLFVYLKLPLFSSDFSLNSHILRMEEKCKGAKETKQRTFTIQNIYETNGPVADTLRQIRLFRSTCSHERYHEETRVCPNNKVYDG